MPGCKVIGMPPTLREGSGKNSSADATEFAVDSQDCLGTGEGGAGLNPAYLIMPTA